MTSIKKVASIALVAVIAIGSHMYRVKETRKYMGKFYRNIEAEKYEKAIANLDKVLLYSPNLAQAYFEKGKTYCEKFNYLADAKYYLEKYLDLFSEPTNAKEARIMLDKVNADLEHANKEAKLPRAPGKHLESFEGETKDSSVLTYYYYWYDEDTGEHIKNPDGSPALTIQSDSKEKMSYRSVKWHKEQLSEMADAGVDTVLPVFWGRAGYYDEDDHDAWSFYGLKAMVKALESLERDGKDFPRVGMFLDENIFAHPYPNIFNLKSPIDLTTKKGMALFYASVRDFFSIVPPRFRATFEGRPIVFVYIQLPLTPKCGQETFTYLKEQFVKDFAGVEPYIVIDYRFNLVSDALFGWGAALSGTMPTIEGKEFSSPVICVGPGYDDSAVQGRNPQIVHRSDGEFFKKSLAVALGSSARMVVIETWNELHEGSAVCRTKEYGDKYLTILKDFTKSWKRHR